MSIVCIGFMGAGKSTAAADIARVLGIEAVDIDRVIEERLGESIAKVFESEGEEAFRAAEERITLELLATAGERVLALGGGAVKHERVREALRAHLVMWLDVDAESAWRRVEGSGRPLAADRAVFDRLYGERQPLYLSLADAVVPTERSQAMEQVLAALQGLPPAARMLWARSASAEYPVFIGPGLLERRFWPAAAAGRRFIVTDGHVGRLYAGALEPAAATVMIMPGEQSKTVAHAELVWSELARAGMTRADLVVALGGGVVGDLAGFCAATYQRGVRYVQVPTTLVAQVDSAYGGKTGIDLPEAKNYVGAYHQPSAVIADTGTLTTLPPEEIAAGYAEVLKTALLAGGELWTRVREEADATDPAVIVACALTKLRIVARDERDTGVRQVLNLGHTIGHAIETSTGYARYRHGEAVGLGLLAALRLSGLEELRAEVARLLSRAGLPTTLDGADPDAVLSATALDKKRQGTGGVPFVLLRAPGEPVAGCVVESRDVALAVRELVSR